MVLCLIPLIQYLDYGIQKGRGREAETLLLSLSHRHTSLFKGQVLGQSCLCYAMSL